MANEQEQQSAVTGQQTAVTQQPEQNIYQTFMSMNPQQMMDFRAAHHRIKQKKEILRNSGDAKLEQYESEIEAGNMTWNQAIEISKKDLSSISRNLDNIYYKKDTQGKTAVTSAQLSQWYDANKNKIGFGEAEQRRYDTRINAVLSKENARDVQFGKITENEAKNVTMLRNYRNDMRTVFNTIKNATSSLYERSPYGVVLEFEDPVTKKGRKQIAKIVKEKRTVFGREVKFTTTEEPAISVEDEEVLSDAFNVVQEEMYRDVGITFVDGKQTGSPETRGTGDQDKINENINIIANLVPKDFIKGKRGYYIGVNDAFVSIPYLEKDIPSLRRMFAEELRRKYLRAKNHISGLADPDPRGLMSPKQEQPQQEEVPTVSTAADFDRLPSGTVFIDPEGNKRTKP